MPVVTRTVKRHYLGGRGYASKALAYQTLAKAELLKECFKYIGTGYEAAVGSQEAIRRAFREKFPVHEQPHAHRLVYHHTFCNECRKEWIRKRGKELQAEAEAK